MKFEKQRAKFVKFEKERAKFVKFEMQNVAMVAARLWNRTQVAWMSAAQCTTRLLMRILDSVWDG